MRESKEFQLLGVMVPKSDKEIIREIANKKPTYNERRCQDAHIG